MLYQHAPGIRKVRDHEPGHARQRFNRLKRRQIGGRRKVEASNLGLVLVRLRRTKISRNAKPLGWLGLEPRTNALKGRYLEFIRCSLLGCYVNAIFCCCICRCHRPRRPFRPMTPVCCPRPCQPTEPIPCPAEGTAPVLIRHFAP